MHLFFILIPNYCRGRLQFFTYFLLYCLYLFISLESLGMVVIECAFISFSVEILPVFYLYQLLLQFGHISTLIKDIIS